MVTAAGTMCMCAPVHVSFQVAGICIQNKRFSLVKECLCSCPVGGRARMNEPSEQGHAKEALDRIRTAWKNRRAVRQLFSLDNMRIIFLLGQKRGRMPFSRHKMKSSKNPNV